jgi:hypothetical protein
MRKTTKRILIALLFAPFVFSACNSLNNKSDDTSHIRILLTDAAGDYQEVNIDVQAVEVIINDSIIELETNQGVYNLLDFVNGKDTILVSDEIPSGMLSQVRLILGENNSIMAGSKVYGMKTPSAQQSGLKFNVHQDVTPGDTYSFVIDFDAARSVVRTGNEKYILKPVIRVFTEVLSGSIEGVVQPPEARPVVDAISPDDDTSSVFSDTVNGQFMIRGLLPGYYDLEFHPDTGFADTSVVDVEVIAGEITRLDTLWFEEE